MRKLIITENDKKNILNQYKVVSIDNKKVISEHQRISELMGVKPKTLILEDGGGKYSWITDMPIFSGWKSTIDEAPTVIKAIESDMAKVSQTLSKNGITPENIRTKSQEWFANYKQKLNITNPMTEGDIIELYIKKNYSTAIAEINNKLTSLYKEASEGGINKIIDEIEKDPDFVVSWGQTTKTNNKELSTNTIDEADLDEVTVDGVIKNTESAETHFNARISEENDAINKYRQKAQDQKRALSSLEQEAIDKANKRIAQYKKLVEHLSIKKKRYQTWKETATQMEKEGIGTGSKTADEVFTYAGKEYTVPSGLNLFQRVFWKGWITRALPLEFFSILGKLIYMAFAKRTFTDTFMESIAGMTNALRKMESEGIEQGKRISEMGEEELEAYGNRLYTELMASTGKKMDTEITFRSFFSDGFGGGAGKMDIQESFNRLENMIKSIEGITDDEKHLIMGQLFSRYMTTKGPVKDLGNFRGLMYFNEDLRSLGVKSDFIKETTEAAEAGTKGVKDGKGKFFDFCNEWFYGAAAKQNWKTLLGNMFKKLVTGVLIGVPAGLKWVVRPILKRGLGFKSVAAVYFRLVLTKISFVVITSFIKFLGVMSLYLLEFAKIQDITGLSGEDYAQQSWDGMLNDIGDGSLNSLVPLHGIDIGWEEQQKDIKVPLGMMKYNAKFGIFESYGVEWFMEFKALVYGKNNIDVKKIQQDAKQEALKEIDNKVSEDTQKIYDNMSPESKEEIKERSGFNTIRNVVSPTSSSLTVLGLSSSEAKSIEQRLFFVPLFQGDLEAIKAHGSWDEYRKKNVITDKDVGGQTFLCSKPLKYDNKNNPKCTADYYRVAACNETYFEEDYDYKKYIYDKETRQVGTMAYIYSGKFVYIKNEELKEKFALTVGENCENIGLVADLPFI